MEGDEDVENKVAEGKNKEVVAKKSLNHAQLKVIISKLKAKHALEPKTVLPKAVSKEKMKGDEPVVRGPSERNRDKKR